LKEANKKMKKIRIINEPDDTFYGRDIVEDGRRVWYFIQVDIFGDGRCFAIWNPSQMLTSYSSFREALSYLDIPRQKPIFRNGKARIIRSFGPYDYKTFEVIEVEDELSYYSSNQG
jgi:hypothetical protein